MAEQNLIDPVSRYPKRPFKKQSQPWPGFAGKMEPRPYHGETSYKGFGRLAGRKALITGGDSGMGRAAAVRGDFACSRSLIAMLVIVAIILAFFSTAALADSIGERAANDRAPTATEVISGLYAFSRFQQGLLESSDLNDNAEVRNLAALRAEEAAKRDKDLKDIQQAAGAEPRAGKTTASAALAEPNASDGPAYIRTSYAAQIPEYESTIALLEHYLKAPDNAALAAFACDQFPVLRSQVRDAERTMADK